MTWTLRRPACHTIEFLDDRCNKRRRRAASNAASASALHAERPDRPGMEQPQPESSAAAAPGSASTSTQSCSTHSYSGAQSWSLPQVSSQTPAPVQRCQSQERVVPSESSTVKPSAQVASVNTHSEVAWSQAAPDAQLASVVQLTAQAVRS